MSEAAISYTVSPVHNIDRYVDLAKQLEDLGTDTLCIKDMAGLLAPLDAYHLVRRLKTAVKVPIHLHSHYTSGMASMSSLMAILGGLDMLDTSMSPLAGGTSHPPPKAGRLPAEYAIRHRPEPANPFYPSPNISGPSAVSTASLKATSPGSMPKF